jgi:1-deoxy-D-xylulose-5-phosphate synthase
VSAHGIGVTVVDPRWIQPLDEKLIGMAAEYRIVAVVEDNSRVGGVGDAVARLLRDGDVDVPVRTFGIPRAFLDHAKRAQVLTEIGLNPQTLARDITAATARGSVLEPTET